MTLYFAYGSNMHRDQMDARCPKGLYLGPAEVEGMRLDFGGISQSRNGGVATLLKNRKVSTPGILWALGKEELDRLDLLEGPRMYSRIPLSVWWRGSKVRAVTYKLQNFFQNDPHPNYWDIISNVYREQGWDTTNLERAKPERHTVFVYGSLRRGAINHHMMAGGATFLGLRKTAPKFRLLDLGPFPAMIPGDSRVHGEIWQVDNTKLAELDRFEGHPGFYRRDTIDLDDGSSAQGYILARETHRRHPIVTCGDWMAHKYP